MAKKSAIENNHAQAAHGEEILRPPQAAAGCRQQRNVPMEERFDARIKLAALPRNGAISACATAAK